MSKVRFTFKILAIAIFTLTLAGMAQAQATRTWVSGVGDDVNPCSRTAPCKTYAGAISKTAKDGEISTLDPGGFGTVTITKSITINGGGTGQGYGSILSALAPQGVLINITDVNDIRKSVKLDGLNINGASTGTDGIRIIAGLSLHVENCVIDGMVGDGIEINAPTANMVVKVDKTTIRNVTGSGIKSSNSAGSAKLIINNVHVSKAGIGVELLNGTLATVNNSLISGNTTGLQTAEVAQGSLLNIISTTISNNSGVGVNVVGGSRARIARCNIVQNGTSLAPAASVDSGGNNSIVGNTTNTAPAGTPFPQN